MLLCGAVLAQTPVDMASEPHHHLLLQNDQVRVFSVTLRPTEQAYVRHEHNFLVVTLQDCEVVIWGPGQSPIPNFCFSQGGVSFFLGDRVVGMRNDRTIDYRNITVEFLNPKVMPYLYADENGEWYYPTGAISPPGDPHAKFVDRLPLRGASAADVQLLAGDSLPPPQPGTAELLVPVTAISLKAGDQYLHQRPGSVLWIGTGRNTGLVNTSSSRAIRFAMVELQPEAK